MINYQTKQQESHVKLFHKVTPTEFKDCLNKVKHRTMLSAEVLYDLWNTIKYITAENLKVASWNSEFGKGCSRISMSRSESLQGNNKVWGFDTFEGIPSLA